MSKPFQIPCSNHQGEYITLICMEPDPYDKKAICIECLKQDKQIIPDNTISINKFTKQIENYIQSIETIKNSQSQLLNMLNNIDQIFKEKMGNAISQIKKTQQSFDNILNNFKIYKEEDVGIINNNQISYYIQLLKKKIYEPLLEKNKDVYISFQKSDDLKECITQTVEKILQETYDIGHILGGEQQQMNQTVNLVQLKTENLIQPVFQSVYSQEKIIIILEDNVLNTDEFNYKESSLNSQKGQIAQTNNFKTQNSQVSIEISSSDSSDFQADLNHFKMSSSNENFNNSQIFKKSQFDSCRSLSDNVQNTDDFNNKESQLNSQKIQSNNRIPITLKINFGQLKTTYEIDLYSDNTIKDLIREFETILGNEKEISVYHQNNQLNYEHSIEEVFNISQTIYLEGKLSSKQFY